MLEAGKEASSGMVPAGSEGADLEVEKENEAAARSEPMWSTVAQGTIPEAGMGVPG